MGEQLQKEIVKSTSKCPLCNGIGYIEYPVENGYTRAKPCTCLNDQIKNNRLAFADIPERFRDITVNSFDVNLYKTDDGKSMAMVAKKLCSNYVKNYEELKADGKGLYLYSETKGSGKTRMIVSIANALIGHKNTPVKFTTAIRILEEIKSTYEDNNKSESNLLAAMSRVDVIIFDDIGAENPTPWVREKFYSILNERLINKKVTMFTSNCKIEHLHLDDRIKNRIQKMAIPIQFPEESIRGYLAQTENQEYINKLLK